MYWFCILPFLPSNRKPIEGDLRGLSTYWLGFYKASGIPCCSSPFSAPITLSVLGLVLLSCRMCFNHVVGKKSHFSSLFVCFCFRQWRTFKPYKLATQWLEWDHILFSDPIVGGSGGGYFRFIRLSPGTERGGQCPWYAERVAIWMNRGSLRKEEGRMDDGVG